MINDNIVINAMDIETIPNKSLVDSLPEPEVALGNTKDPDKIREKIAEAKKKQIDKMALSPFFGRVCSFSVYGNKEENRYFKVIPEISEAAEIELVTHILEKLVLPDHFDFFITWNGKDFDFPFIYKRAAMLRIPLPANCPPLSHWTKKYSVAHHCDLMQEYTAWGRDGHLSLDLAGKQFLGAGKTKRDYSTYVELIESGKGEFIGLDNLCDTELTYNLYNVLKPYLF